MKKRGMSDVVTNVLLILLVVAITSIIAFFIYQTTFAGFVNLNDVDLEFNNLEAVYNNKIVRTNLGQDNSISSIYVRVDRGEGDVNLSGLNFKFYIGNEIYSCKRTNVPSAYETLVYSFESPLLASLSPDSIEIIPIIKSPSGKEKTTKKGFFINEISVTDDILEEKITECGGFCCGDSFPEVPTSLEGL